MSATNQTLTSTVAAEVAAGDVLTCPQVARRAPSTRQGRPLHPSTVLRWMLSGVRTANGRTVRLEAVRLGGRWVTSAAAYRRFVVAQTPTLDETPPLHVPTPTQRAKAAERAGRQLDKIGL
jgi:hypothetical protein